ncbi:MAG TPA: phosphomannomutase/phosphoglucomutase [Spirochaetia bacterium]|nr:phosphomannomutase/phosphoglucomutase [Spirochaetia bacterium]
MGVFKSYDIRGIYGAEWDADTALRIGLHLPGLLGARGIGVGRDARLSSGEIFAALTKGLTEAGADVTDIGLCDTPAVYFATAFYGLDGSVMITASHNPPQYNGLKVSRRDAIPVGLDTGLAELEKSLDQPHPAPRAPGSVHHLDIRKDYVAHLARFRSDLNGLRVVIDCSNGMAGIFLRDVLEPTGGDFRYLFDMPDGRFPNHAPNPLEEENLRVLKEQVVRQRAALGICFDGDADRVMFVDETGKFVSPDLLIALLGEYYFRDHPQRLSGGSNVATYDVRSSRSVVEILRDLGADPRICKVGHSYAKKLLRDTKGIVGGELAGHYYFRENYYCDSGMIAALIVLEVLARSGEPFSALVGKIKKYFFSGEINFTVPNGREILDKVRTDYATGALTDLDGIRLDFPDWWFNLRVSNTEPLLRLVVEARTRDALQDRTDELKEKIRKYAGRA